MPKARQPWEWPHHSFSFPFQPFPGGQFNLFPLKSWQMHPEWYVGTDKDPYRNQWPSWYLPEVEMGTDSWYDVPLEWSTPTGERPRFSGGSGARNLNVTKLKLGV